MMNGPTIAFFPEASFGAALNCVGIAQALRAKGAKPVFICHPGFTGLFAEYGFKEYHLPAPARVSEQTAEDYWQSFVERHTPHFDLDPLAQLETYVGPTWEAIVDTAIAAEPGLSAVLRQIRPNAIVLDNVIMFPAIANAGCPWVRVVSCAETELPDKNVPPYLSGLSPDDVKGRAVFEARYRSSVSGAHGRYSAMRKSCGLQPLPVGLFLETSRHLNLMLSPDAVRYERAAPLPETTFRYLNGCVRDEATYPVPVLPRNDGPLVYVSFGSLGSTDTGLTNRLIDVFSGISARFLVNVGGLLEAYSRVPDNVYLASWFPQPSVVAQCDLFIHHGGNNSFCEALYYGVPSLILPYCWDGHDNAQRAQAKGLGRRIDRSSWTADEMSREILELFSGSVSAAKLARFSAQMQASDGVKSAADAILDLI